jgi:rhamnulose-1-phosphate aldolase
MEHGNLFSNFVDACAMGGEHGWHEAQNGGMSLLLDTPTIMELEPGLDLRSEYVPIGVSVPRLAREFLLITGEERAFRDAKEYPDELCGIIQISPDGTAYRTVMGFVSGQKPTENLPTHLMAHVACLEKGFNAHSVIYHCHPSNLIALTYLLPLEQSSFSRTLSRSGVSCAIALPDGVGLVEELLLDQPRLAQRTAEEFHHHNAVVWAFHGVMAAGHTLHEVIGNVEALEKAAEIRLKLLQVPGGPRQEPEL